MDVGGLNNTGERNKQDTNQRNNSEVHASDIVSGSHQLQIHISLVAKHPLFNEKFPER